MVVFKNQMYKIYSPSVIKIILFGYLKTDIKNSSFIFLTMKGKLKSLLEDRQKYKQKGRYQIDRKIDRDRKLDIKWVDTKILDR